MKHTLPAIIILISNLFNPVCAQKEHNLEDYANDNYHKTTPLVTSLTKDPLVGSPYLTSYWMKGVVEFKNGTTIPTREKMYYFNFDKTKNILIVGDASNIIRYYKSDSVTRFILLDSLNRIYTFEIIEGISHSIYQQPVVESDYGYSLYKRLITKLQPADYTNYGYSSFGTKHDSYVDFYEYYFLYPDKKTFRKFYLEGSAIKKVFGAWPEQLEAQFTKYNGRLTEESLINLIEYINKVH